MNTATCCVVLLFGNVLLAWGPYLDLSKIEWIFNIPWVCWSQLLFQLHCLSGWGKKNQRRWITGTSNCWCNWWWSIWRSLYECPLECLLYLHIYPVILQKVMSEMSVGIKDMQMRSSVCQEIDGNSSWRWRKAQDKMNNCRAIDRCQGNFEN